MERKKCVVFGEVSLAEDIVPKWLQMQWEGLNFRRHRQRKMGRKVLAVCEGWVNYFKLADMKKPAAEKVDGALLIKISEKLRKHFNQFFLSCLYCNNLLQVFLVYAPLRSAQNRCPLDILCPYFCPYEGS